MAEPTDREIRIIASGFRVVDAAADEPTLRSAALSEPSPPMGDEAIVEGLAAAAFQVVRSLGLAPAPDDPRRTFGVDADTGAASLQVEVPLAPGEAAALLVEDADGLLSWQFPAPQSPGSARRGLGDDNAIARFAVVGGDAASGLEGRRGFPGGWIVDKVTRPVRVHVLRFLARRSIDAAMAHIEGGLASGPVLVDGTDPQTWRADDLAAARTKLAAASLAGTKPVRVLLLVHGTFSTTAGSFGGLAGHPMLADYDLVLGYDHRTLAEEPVANAESVLAMLHALDLPEGSAIDAIAFSRGGLVLRVLIEQLLPVTPLRATIDRAIFVGCTNGGTLLAEPDNWRALLELYTNILVAAAHVATAVTGTAAAAPFIAAAIRLMGGFAQMLSQVAITDRYLPGLAAMEPDGPLVEQLNRADAPGPGTALYHVIDNDFEPGGAHGGPRFTVLDRIADRLYGDNPNDLVVHTASMSAFGPSVQLAGRQRVATLGVFHTVYFSTDEVVDRIAAWLAGQQDQQQQQQEEQHQQEEQPAPWRAKDDDFFDKWSRSEARPSDGRGDGWGRRSPAETANADRSDQASITYPATPPELATAPAPAPPLSAPDFIPPTAERYFAGEMNPFPKLDRPASVYVTVSPDAILVADHAAASASAQAITVSKAMPLTIALIPLGNCEVVGASTQQADPADSSEQVRKFLVRGLAAGSAEVRVELRQGIQTFAQLVLNPVFVEARPATLAVTAEAGPPPAIDRKGRAVLRVYEFRTGDRNLRLQFNLTSDDPEIADLQLLSIDGAVPLDRYAPAVLQQVEKAYRLRSGNGSTDLYTSFLERLTSDAKERTNALIPEPIRRRLWRYRDSITSIQIISDEPYIPWELMYLSNPDPEEDDQKGHGFLAEWGLTRWLHDAPIGRRLLRPNEGSCHYVIPAYADARTVLKGAAAEKQALIDRFGGAIGEIPATSSAVRKFIAESAGTCALLHFACHGRSVQGDVIASELLMLDQTNDRGEVIPDTLTWQDVSTCADFGRDGGPLVFVNACQTGQGGDGIVGPAGFARAFLRPNSRRGAAAFIGALWSVDDTLANRFSAAVYDGLEKGESLGAAVKAARALCKTNNDFTWLAYTVFAG